MESQSLSAGSRGLSGGSSRSLSARPSLLSISRYSRASTAPTTPAAQPQNNPTDEIGSSTALAKEQASADLDSETVEGRTETSDSRALLREQLRRSDSHASRTKRPRPATSRATTAVDLEASTLSISPTTHARRYFILSSAGKLIYASDADDGEAATTYVGVMQALVSIFADENDDRLRYVNAGQMRICFLLRAPLYLVCVSDWGEPEAVLRMHLEYLHLHVLSVVTASQLQRIFKQSSNFDLTRLLEGSDTFFASLIRRLHDDFSLLTGTLEVFRVAASTREQVAKALTPKSGQTQDLLYAIVLAAGRVVSLLRPKKHSVHPSDLHILLNTIAASPSLTTAGSETWLPICLPRYNSTGFLHAYVAYLTSDIGVVFVSADREAFFELREWKFALADKLSGSTMKALEAAIPKQRYLVGETGVAGVRHFIYKAKSIVQITTPAFDDDYEHASNRRRLVTLYQRCHDLLRPRAQSGRQAAKLVLLRSDNEAVLAWSTDTFELYVAVSPLLPTNAAVAAAHAVVKWVKEHDELFLSSAPVF